ncbi:putative cytochrome B5 [Sporormia fimetaria CBS 119925]|uniref:NADH-cytochrome b5 reductase 1 n=1 Tax=Sporormia fimetaria CBS 119925 TaxID=1340428 RepID=A0A6A6V3H6_9PLEO|nr:putative cytochrome B5 [Sporormia fimetaria CBS 119925]
MDEVKKHSRKDDLWVVVHNKVYDITKYLDDHPGGIEVLVEVAGADATEAFEEIGHSEEAREALEPFYVGDLPPDEHADAIEIYRPTFETVAQSSTVLADALRKKQKALINRVVGTVFKLGATGGVGAVAFLTYTRGWKTVAETLSLSSLSSRILRRLPASSKESNSTFWAGFGIATAANLVLTAGLGMYASTKLDVQHEFTRHAPRRKKQADRIVPYPHGNPNSSTQKTVKAPSKEPVIDPKTWRNFKLTKKTLVSPNVYRFVFALPNPDDSLGLPIGQHIALRATVAGKPVARSYTPVSNDSDSGRIELLVKVYPAGLLTNHLANMNEGDMIKIRGPKGAMQYSRSYASEIGMIAGGTGITPMYQLIRAICEDKEDNTKVSLLYANNTEEDILLREELENFATENPHKFKVQHVLTQASDKWTGLRGFVNQDMIKEHLAPATDSSKVLLCGPPPMVNAMKKNLAGLGWKEPGAISKASDAVFLF